MGHAIHSGHDLVGGKPYANFLPDEFMVGSPGCMRQTVEAYRSKKKEAFLERGMFKRNIHQRRMPRRPLPDHCARVNAKRSAILSAVEHAFTGQ